MNYAIGRIASLQERTDGADLGSIDKGSVLNEESWRVEKEQNHKRLYSVQ